MKRTIVVINGEKYWHGHFPESEFEVVYRRLQECSWVLRDGALWCVDREAAVRVDGLLWRVGAIRPDPELPHGARNHPPEWSAVRQRRRRIAARL
jgi:ribosomal protein S6--L-glutamate ligase